ncbi:MAG: M18 family aminopeptidase [Clostridiales bacterium]|nr:M18 family aminopeptidase [Clostridiales bacterium]
MSEVASELCRWLKRGVSPYHTVAAAEEYLKEHGFSALSLQEKFSVERGGKYYVEHGTALFAFTVGQQADFFRIAAAHTDWPCMRIKPVPEQLAGGCCKLSVEPYGGAILNTWLDRPLSPAGIAAVRTEDPMHPEIRLVSWDEPLMTVPNLAIHMNREVNKGVATKPNVDMMPLCRTVKEGWSKDGYLLGKLADKLAVRREDVLSFELYVYCAEEPQFVGFEQDFLSAPRLDNLTSVHACLTGLVRGSGKGIHVAVLYDNEEIGSNTRHGADSSTLSIVLEKIALALGMDRAAYLDACTKGFLLSCDVAHAAHPNHMEFADAAHAPVMNGGVALKRSPRYSSEAETCAVIRALCDRHDIPLQTYMNRADLPGGSTVGSMASALLAMPAADIGVPILAMHSARELMGAQDQEAICRLCEAFFDD